MAMSTKTEPIKLPTFVFATDKTNTILSGYTESGYTELFKANFPVLRIDNIVEIICTVKEIKDLASDPDLNPVLKTGMEELSHNLILYLCGEIYANKEVLLPEINKIREEFSPEINKIWPKLPPEQQEVLSPFYAKHKEDAGCTLASVACGIASGGTLAAFFVFLACTNNYLVFVRFLEGTL